MRCMVFYAHTMTSPTRSLMDTGLETAGLDDTSPMVHMHHNSTLMTASRGIVHHNHTAHPLSQCPMFLTNRPGLGTTLNTGQTVVCEQHRHQIRLLWNEALAVFYRFFFFQALIPGRAVLRCVEPKVPFVQRVLTRKGKLSL
jgi:hypothetical protein